MIPDIGGSLSAPPVETAELAEFKLLEDSEPAAEDDEDPELDRSEKAHDALFLGGAGRVGGVFGPEIRDSYVKSSKRSRGISLDGVGSFRDREPLKCLFDIVAPHKRSNPRRASCSDTYPRFDSRPNRKAGGVAYSRRSVSIFLSTVIANLPGST
nr:uncharacterized protein CTRU02_12842 [Colletotrichum truncatum]KAF6784075.1 hypothetical protein CTRU02_12842 [Colletotrichum truncatum]